MELRQLKYFVKTAELLSFSEASKALFITQSTLSQQVKQLETELNAQLFQRNSHGVTLTEAGTELLPYAYNTLNAARACIEHLRDVQNLVTGTLNIGVTYTFSPILTESVLAFMKLHPDVKLNVYYKTMEELMYMLEKQEVDFVLAFKPTHPYSRIESHILFDNHLAIVVSPTHPLATRSKISLADLQDYDLALLRRGLQARNSFEDLINGKDYHFTTRIELNEVNILLKVVKESQLATILSEASIHGEDGVAVIPLDEPLNEMEGCIHFLKDSYQKRSAQEFVRILCESDTIKEKAFNWLSNISSNQP